MDDICHSMHAERNQISINRAMNCLKMPSYLDGLEIQQKC